MEPTKNPYSPGAGAPPPELAGRDEVRKKTNIALGLAKQGHFTRGIVLFGLRGVGKTVLLVQVQKDAETAGMKTAMVEVPENESLVSILVPQLRTILLSMSSSEKFRRAASALMNFAKAFKIQIGDIGLGWEPEPGLADNANLESDLLALLESIGEAAKAEQTVLVLLIDELQYAKEKELGALCAALHRITQRHLPILFIGAGLPQLHGHLGRAKSYTERLFEFTEIDALPTLSAKDAITKPAQAENIKIDENALNEIVKKTHGYPYFLQEWGKHVWDIADTSPITLEDVNLASRSAIKALDDGFFRVRFDRLTPGEKRYLRAMAKLGNGPSFRSSDIADVLQKEVTTLGPVRAKLISKGAAYSPAHGDIAFTVPLFDEFIQRVMPEDNLPDL